MTEEEARAWVGDEFGSERLRIVEDFGNLVLDEADRQNLISPSTRNQLWVRHLTDSAQLAKLVAIPPSSWLDIGTGAGFPGMVLGILIDCKMLLVEPRARRAHFLKSAASALRLGNVEVCQARVEALNHDGPFDVVSARAVASIDAIFAMTRNVISPTSRYILPRGRSGVRESDAVQSHWQGLFHVEQSLTDPDSYIVIADGVTR